MQWSTLFFCLAMVGLLLALVARVWQLIVAARLNLLLAIGSFFCFVFGFVLLLRHWSELKRPWATVMLAFSCGMVVAFAGVLWYLVERGQRYDSAALYGAPSPAEP